MGKYVENHTTGFVVKAAPAAYGALKGMPEGWNKVLIVLKNS
jgi:hypothetical protein